MEASQVLSAFVDGEAVDAGELAMALAEPGARETLIDVVRLRIAVADDSEPSDAMVRETRWRLTGGAGRRIPRVLRLAAAIVVGALAAIGALDLVRAGRPVQRPDDPPVATRVIRFEPGVDWKPIERR